MVTHLQILTKFVLLLVHSFAPQMVDHRSNCMIESIGPVLP